MFSPSGHAPPNGSGSGFSLPFPGCDVEVGWDLDSKPNSGPDSMSDSCGDCSSATNHSSKRILVGKLLTATLTIIKKKF